MEIYLALRTWIFLHMCDDCGGARLNLRLLSHHTLDTRPFLLCMNLNPPIHEKVSKVPTSLILFIFLEHHTIGFNCINIYLSTKASIKMLPKPRLNVQNFPRPPLLEKTSRHLVVKYRGQTIAETSDAYWVLETYHSPSQYPFCIHDGSSLSPSIT